MSNIYILAYKYEANETSQGVLTFTNKKLAIKTAQYYRDRLNCYFVSLRNDKQSQDGFCNILGFVEF